MKPTCTCLPRSPICPDAECSRSAAVQPSAPAGWLAQGAVCIAIDLSMRQLTHAARHPAVRLVQADGSAIPLADCSVDLACSAYGALPFVASSADLLRDVFRVLRPGGRFVFSVTHPIRWALPDDPGAGGLTISSSYFDRTPYVEMDADGRATYVEHHRTLGDWVRDIVGAGFDFTDLVEPQWPDTNPRVWGGWSPLRGRLIPGTAVFACDKPGG